MSTTTRKQRSYDHRLRELVQSTRDVNLAIQRGVPRSTAHGWLTATPTEVITFDALEMNVEQLQREVVWLQRRNARLDLDSNQDGRFGTKRLPGVTVSRTRTENFRMSRQTARQAIGVSE
jgi:hypothetical protein